MSGPILLDTSAARSMSRPAIAAALLVAAVVATWLPALDASFQFDDWNVIVRDPRVQSLAAWLAGMPGIRPLLKLSYALQQAAGHGPAAFRTFNVAVHAANAVLVALLLRMLGRHLALPEARAAFAALVGATVFALHPVQTEAVTYVSGRSSSLSALFALCALLAWLRGLDTPAELRWRWLSCAAFAVALGVKEPVAVLPLVMAAWLFGRGAARTIPRRIAPHLLLLLGGALLMLAWPPYRAVLEGSLGARPIGTNLLTQVDAISWLLGQLLRFDRLNADPALATVTTLDAALLLRAAALVALAATGLVLLRRRPAAGFAIAWFFLWLLPTNSLLPRLDVVNERQLYLAIVGPAWLLGLALSGAWRAGAAPARRVTSAAGAGAVQDDPASPPPSPPAAHTPPSVASIATAATTAAWLALLALAIGLALATQARNRVYATEIAFWEDVARKSPHNARAANNLGYAYALACRDTEALAQFAHAMQLDPHDYRAPVNHRLLSEGVLFTENERHCETPPRAAGR